MVQAMGGVVPPSPIQRKSSSTVERSVLECHRSAFLSSMISNNCGNLSVRLGERHDFLVIGEASDGLEAVQKAVELKPDLVLMDIGLPSQNGIEAARQIFNLVSEIKFSS